MSAGGMPCSMTGIMNHYRVSKKLEVIFVLVLFLFGIPFGALAERPIPKPRGLVNDFADVIPASHEQKIGLLTGELFQKTGIPVVVVTMPDIGGAEYNEYANRLYNAWGIGRKGEDKGVLIFVTVKERKMRIETGYGVEGILPDGLVGEIRDRHMIPHLRHNDYGQGLLAGTLAVSRILAEHSGVKLTGQAPVRKSTKRKSVIGVFPLLLLIIFFAVASGMSRRRGGSWIFFLPLLLGGGGRSGYGGGGFGGFSGGFGGFGGGMSGGGGAGGGF